jgi:aryl-alcohol dehydrogenase-like predicted oxidoreductase
MRARGLGRTGFEVSPVGFGGWGLGGGAWRDVDPRDAQRALRLALDAGVTFVDTALLYGKGDGERRVGEVVRDVGARDWAVVATKVPLPHGATWPPAPETPLERLFPVDHVVRSVEQSLRNLRAEAIPLEQLHVWRDEWLDSSHWPVLRGTMERLVREGKVLHWGVSALDHAPETALRVLDEPIVETVQVLYNVFDRSAEAELLPRAAERKVGVIARSPFDEGALTGAVHPEVEFHPTDFRSRYFSGERRVEVAERVARLRAFEGDEARTLAELALLLCLSRPEVSTVIPGMRRPEHVLENLATGERGGLTDGLLAALAEHTWTRNWYEWSGAA